MAIWIYDGHDNTAVKQCIDLIWPDFNKITEEGFFRVIPIEEERIMVSTPRGEQLILRQSEQTDEQAVILFATLLGLREAARE